MSDQTQHDSNSAAGGASALTAGLEVSAAMMTNDELAAAIAYAFERCDQRYVGVYSTSTTDAGKVMLAHLKELLAVQRGRAGMVTTSNKQ